MTTLRQFSIFFDPYYWRTARLIARNGLTKQYRNSFLGILWTLLQPMTMIIVYAIVMPMIMRFPVQNYVLYILCTMPLWNLISTTLITSSNSLLSQGEILKRCMISSTIFPIADVLRLVQVYFITFATMYAIGLALGLPGSWYVLLIPLYLLPVVITLMALAVSIAFTAPYIRDIGELMMVTMNVMLWLSAVPYPVSVVPPEVQWVFQWNPFYLMLQPVITLAYERQLPDFDMMTRLFVLMGCAIAVSYCLYRRCRRNFVYYL